MILKIAFWNTHNNQMINPIIADIFYENKINLIVLAEYLADAGELIRELQKKHIQIFPYSTSGCDRVTMFGTIRQVTPGNQNKYYSIQLINQNNILCGIHLPSPLYSGHQERRNIIIDMVLEDIQKLENDLESSNTIILGDFNENPYDAGCLSADKFHGISSADDAIKGSRKIMGKSFKMFYNPTWNLFGDFQYPPGTYYHKGSHPCHSFWNLYDQVILRPSMRTYFIEKSLKIITKTQNHTLVDVYQHPRKDISDHLPIMFEIKEALL